MIHSGCRDRTIGSASRSSGVAFDADATVLVQNWNQFSHEPAESLLPRFGVRICSSSSKVIAKAEVRPHIEMLDTTKRLPTAECLDTNAVGQYDPTFVPDRAMKIAIQIDEVLIGLELVFDCP